MRLCGHAKDGHRPGPPEGYINGVRVVSEWLLDKVQYVLKLIINRMC